MMMSLICFLGFGTWLCSCGVFGLGMRSIGLGMCSIGFVILVIGLGMRSIG